MNLSHHFVEESAQGTSGHTHHRAVLTDGHVRQSYWRCPLGTAPLHACPQEPDPVARLAAKVAEARGRRVAAPVAEHRLVCDRHDRSRWRLYSARAGWLCLSCRAEKRRVERVGRRIAREALRVA